jgi:hypothetical protein
MEYAAAGGVADLKAKFQEPVCALFSRPRQRANEKATASL